MCLKLKTETEKLKLGAIIILFGEKFYDKCTALII